MKKQKTVVFLLSILLGVAGAALFLSKAYARQEAQNNTSHPKYELKTSLIAGKPETNEQAERWQKVKISEAEFEIDGLVENLFSNSMVVSGQTVYIDPLFVKEYKQKGIIIEGGRIKVKGIVKDSLKYVTEINMVGTGQGRYKVEYKSNSEGSPLPTVQPSPTPEPTVNPTPVSTALPTPVTSPTPEPTVNPTPLASASPSPLATVTPSPETDLTSETETDVEVRTLLEDLGVIIKMSGPAEKVQAFLEQIKSFFGDLLQ